jgi:hypothetical protein
MSSFVKSSGDGAALSSIQLYFIHIAFPICWNSAMIVWGERETMPTKKRKQAPARPPAAHSNGAKAYNVFISWSGARSLHVAAALAKWLPTVLQQAQPWLSRNIDKGARPLPEITGALETIEVGISCLTPENLGAPWIMFEGGALSKSLGDKTRLCTYLLAGLKHQEVPMPLGMFQHTRATKEETKEMIVSLNKVIGKTPLADAVLDNTFEKMWPDLAEKIDSMPDTDSELPEKRTTQDMIAEILEWVRQIGYKDRWNEEKQRTADNYRALFGADVSNLISIPHHGSRTVIDDDEWTKNGVVNCPKCRTAPVAVGRGGLKECERCGATNW